MLARDPVVYKKLGGGVSQLKPAQNFYEIAIVHDNNKQTTSVVSRKFVD